MHELQVYFNIPKIRSHLQKVFIHKETLPRVSHVFGDSIKQEIVCFFLFLPRGSRLLKSAIYY